MNERKFIAQLSRMRSIEKATCNLYSEYRGRNLYTHGRRIFNRGVLQTICSLPSLTGMEFHVVDEKFACRDNLNIDAKERFCPTALMKQLSNFPSNIKYLDITWHNAGPFNIDALLSCMSLFERLKKASFKFIASHITKQFLADESNSVRVANLRQEESSSFSFLRKFITFVADYTILPFINAFISSESIIFSPLRRIFSKSIPDRVADTIDRDFKHESYAFRTANLLKLEEFSWFSRGYKIIYYPIERVENITIGPDNEFKMEKSANRIDLLSIDPYTFSRLEDVSHVKKLTINECILEDMDMWDQFKSVTNIQEVVFGPFIAEETRLKILSCLNLPSSLDLHVSCQSR